MEEIKANEILRTADGKLYKIVSATKDDFLCLEMGENSTKVELLSDLNPIIKHSSEIINIVERGDYVNGYLVVYDKSSDGYIEIAIGDDTEQGELLENEDIESIVTKEQFNQMKYIVGDESNE